MFNLKKTLLTMRLIHGFLIASIVVYVGVVWKTTEAKTSSAPLDPNLLYVLCGVAAMTLGAIPIVRKRLLPPAKDGGPVSDDQRSPAVSGALQKLFSAQIASWALAESVAIDGLVLSFTTFDLVYVEAFGAVAIAALVALRPTRERLEATVRAAA